MRLSIAVAILLLSTGLFSQTTVSPNYTEVDKAFFDKCSETENLFRNPAIAKHSGKVIIAVANKKSKIFIDNNTDSGFEKYEYFGDIKGTKLSIVKKEDYNHEWFYVVHRSTGAIDILIGPPIFAKTKIDFACINSPGTDEKQQIQLCEIKGGKVKTRMYLKGKPDTFFESIRCIKSTSLLAKDNKGKYWKLNF